MNTPSDRRPSREAADKTPMEPSSAVAKPHAKQSRDASKANPPLQHDIAGDLDNGCHA